MMMVIKLPNIILLHFFGGFMCLYAPDSHHDDNEDKNNNDDNDDDVHGVCGMIAVEKQSRYQLTVVLYFRNSNMKYLSFQNVP